MSNHDEKDLLSRELHQRSAGIGGHPIGLDDVRGRARSIRRRRNAVRGVVAAVVLAVAVPVGLSTTDLLGSSRTPAPPVASGSVEPSPDTPAPTPEPDGSFPLTVHGLTQGEPAGVPYVVAKGDQLVTPDGTFGPARVLRDDHALQRRLAGDRLGAAPGQDHHARRQPGGRAHRPGRWVRPGGQPGRLPRRLRRAREQRHGHARERADRRDRPGHLDDRRPRGRVARPRGVPGQRHRGLQRPDDGRDGDRPHRRHAHPDRGPPPGRRRLRGDRDGLRAGLLRHRRRLLRRDGPRLRTAAVEELRLLEPPIQPGRSLRRGGRVVLRRRLADADHPRREHRGGGRPLLTRAARHRGRRDPGGVGGRRLRAGLRRRGRRPGDGAARHRRVDRGRDRRGRRCGR